MAPLLRRSWALRGQPSESRHKAGHREKVSVLAALCLTPTRDRLRLGYQTLVNGYFSNVEVAAFLEATEPGLPWPAIVLWDRGTMHQGDPIRTLLEQSQGRWDIEPLPAHASELMPVEQVWKWLKYGRLCNFTPQDATDLEAAVVRELEAIHEDQEMLCSLFHLSALPMPRTLLW
jgi:hypothetical protein